MAATRFFYDDCRTIKQLQQATDPGRWILNVPGNGEKPCYIEDPYVRIQKWGGNLRTNVIGLESELMGVNKPLSRDCLEKDNYKRFNVQSEEISYPKCNVNFTEQSRTITPAWMIRGTAQNNWEYPPHNPQANTCLPFQNNISSRIIEKDNFTPKRTCLIKQLNNYTDNELPDTNFLYNNKNIGSSKLCSQTNACTKINNL